MKNVIFSTSVLAIAILMAFFSSCDIIEPPYVDQTGSSIGADSLFVQQTLALDPFEGVTITRKVLLEEFTGHKCGNCPEVSDLGLELKNNVHQGDMYFMAIHAGSLAKYDSTDTKYFSNHTTPEGDEYFDLFIPVDAVPFGLINRSKNTSGGYNYGSGQWRTAVAAELDKPAEAGVHVSTLYDATTRKMTIVTQVKYLADATDQEYLCLLLVEDEVIDWQKDYRLGNMQDVEDYHHHEMLRGSINGIWGEPLTTNVVKSGDTFDKVYTFDLDEKFDEAHCRILAFAYNFDTKSFRQVTKAKLIP